LFGIYIPLTVPFGKTLAGKGFQKNRLSKSSLRRNKKGCFSKICKIALEIGAGF
jgi:hypothetical protein